MFAINWLWLGLRRSAVVVDLIAGAFTNRRRRRRRVAPAPMVVLGQMEDDKVPLIPAGRGALRNFLLNSHLAESEDTDDDDDYSPSTPPAVSEESGEGEPETEDDDSD